MELLDQKVDELIQRTNALERKGGSGKDNVKSQNNMTSVWIGRYSYPNCLEIVSISMLVLFQRKWVFSNHQP